MIGVLDIYGFEIFGKNGFEQFCINYCNEKLQQLFIELTLKSEQEEYAREGIPWSHIDYFNNNVICDLIDAKNRGIYALLDEECLRPGDVSDLTFLQKLNSQVKQHKHFDSREKSKSDKTLDPTSFRLKHYAGDVTYCVDGFLEKNLDTVNRDALYLFNTSSKASLSTMFPESPSNADLKRPETSGTQFKNSIQSLTKNLLQKQPHYVRCIKPNTQKQSSIFEEDLVHHQCRYLGILENVRVRRAGYCFRMDYSVFVEKFKAIAKETWPNWRGNPKDGALKIVMALKWRNDDYALGASKIFIRTPSHVVEILEKFETIKLWLVIKIQSRFRAHLEQIRYRKWRRRVIALQSWWKGVKVRN